MSLHIIQHGESGCGESVHSYQVNVQQKCGVRFFEAEVWAKEEAQLIHMMKDYRCHRELIFSLMNIHRWMHTHLFLIRPRGNNAPAETMTLFAQILFFKISFQNKKPGSPRNWCFTRRQDPQKRLVLSTPAETPPIICVIITTLYLVKSSHSL